MEFTDDEERGVAEATQIYKLADGEVFRHIGERFPAARKYVSRMLREKYSYRHSKVSRMISQEGEKQATYYTFDGEHFDIGHLARTFARVHSVEVGCPPELRDLTCRPYRDCARIQNSSSRRAKFSIHQKTDSS